MKTGKETKRAGNIHRQQLFYCMGRSIDDRNGKRKLLRDELVTEVLRQLRGSLEQGLWVKKPRFPEKFELRGSSFALDLPIACFTEWSPGESLPHSAEYGRIGLGFPKRWVIERGGQSVTYFRHNAKGSFLHAMFKLLASQGTGDGNGIWEPRPGVPGNYLPYLPGGELFTLVLPDNKVVSKVPQVDWFTERLFTPWKHYPELKKRRMPRVTVLSHSDIGTI
jgi:hypothetical protein